MSKVRELMDAGDYRVTAWYRLMQYLNNYDAEMRKPCVWTWNTDGFYKTACRSVWEFTEGTPAENGVKFCQGCGHPVEVKKGKGK